MSEEQEAKDMVKGMAALVLNSNRISEIHEKNMKMYPLIFFDNVKEVTIDYDLTYVSEVDLDDKNNITINSPLANCFVHYRLLFNGEPNTENLQQRFEALESSTRALFWKDLRVHISFNEQKVYESKNGK